ncbi:hypothetical protein LXA43DRAFT_1154271, partial [Ganoderma leucocontextum]
INCSARGGLYPLPALPFHLFVSRLRQLTSTSSTSRRRTTDMSNLYHPRLSVDVLLTILPYLNQRTALALSAANTQLRAYVSANVLRRPVVLRSYPGILSFLAFLRTGGSLTSHCDKVVDLDITIPASFPSIQISRLRDTLVALTELRSLTIRNPEVVFATAVVLRRAFEGLRNLEVLTLVGAGCESFKLLPSSRSSIPSIRVLDPIWRFPMAEALVGRESCKDLVAHNCYVPPVPHPQDTRATTFPELRRLHIPRYSLEPGNCIAGLMVIVPDLRVLDVGTDYSSRTWSEEAFDRRHRNKTATMDVQLDAHNGRRPPVWPGLELVRGGLVDLLMFGNSCRAIALELIGQPIATPALQRLIPVVVADHAPRILRLSLSGPQFDMGVFVAERLQMRSVHCLHVRIVLTSVPTEAEWTACELTTSRHVLQRALTDLTYAFGECMAVFVELEAVDPALRDFLAGKDREQFARSIMARSEIVHVVCVSTSLGPAYWRLCRVIGGVRELEQPRLPNDEGRRIFTKCGAFSEAYPLCEPSSSEI